MFLSSYLPVPNKQIPNFNVFIFVVVTIRKRRYNLASSVFPGNNHFVINYCRLYTKYLWEELYGISSPRPIFEHKTISWTIQSLFGENACIALSFLPGNNGKTIKIKQVINVSIKNTFSRTWVYSNLASFLSGWDLFRFFLLHLSLNGYTALKTTTTIRFIHFFEKHNRISWDWLSFNYWEE